MISPEPGIFGGSVPRVCPDARPAGGAARTLDSVTRSPRPTEATRWRCTRCGNLTRFDVVRRATTREYVHVDLAGDQVVEERELLAEEIDSVRCRWCDGVDTVELVARPAAGAADGAGRGAGTG